MKMKKRLTTPITFKFPFAISKAQEEPIVEGAHEGDLRWIVEGYCAVAGNVDEQFDRIEKAALKGALEYLKSYTTVLFNHDPDRPIGKIIDSAIKESRIWVQVQISKTEQGIWDKIVEGIINSFSISGDIEDFEYVFDKELNRQVRVIKKFKIYEASLVTVPANSEAKTLVAYMTKALSDANIEEAPEQPATKVLPTSTFFDVMSILMEVSKAMDWKAKLTQAIKSIGDVAAKVTDDAIKNALQEIQKLLTDVAAEVPQDYPQQKSVELENRVNSLEKKLSEVEVGITSKMSDFEKKFSDLDDTLGGLSEMLKSMITGENPDGGSGSGGTE